MKDRRRVAVLISGRGSNLGALMDAATNPVYPAEIVLVVSNRADAAGIAAAEARGIATSVIRGRDFADRTAHEAAIDQALNAAGVDLVCLAGYMRILTAGFVGRWQGRMINIHPSLLPYLPGLETHRRAIAAGVRIHGCTVHFVTATMDEGPIIAQAAVPVLPGDDDDSLAARVLTAEHRLYPLALKMVAEGAVVMEDDRAVWKRGALNDDTAHMLVSPATERAPSAT